MPPGWVKIHRSITKNKTAERGIAFLGAMVWFVCRANFEKNITRGKEIGCGACLFTEAELQENWHMTRKQVRGVLAKLVEDGFLNIRERGPFGTIATVCNYERYQHVATLRGRSGANERANERANKRANQSIFELITQGDESQEIKESYPELLKDSGAGKRAAERANERAAYNNNKEEDINNRILRDFNAFWEAYAKKEDRKRCFEYWRKMTGNDRSAAIRAADVYRRRTPDMRYRKLPLTWLRGNCWNDEANLSVNPDTEVNQYDF